jgi:hypothetical protein
MAVFKAAVYGCGETDRTAALHIFGKHPVGSDLGADAVKSRSLVSLTARSTSSHGSPGVPM